MGEAKQRGTFEQRKAMAQERDAVVQDIFAEKDLTAWVVRRSLWQIPMTPARLASLKERSQKVVPG